MVAHRAMERRVFGTNEKGTGAERRFSSRISRSESVIRLGRLGRASGTSAIAAQGDAGTVCEDKGHSDLRIWR
jgi:hypothetical protein